MVNKLYINITVSIILILLGLFPLLIRFNIMTSNPLNFISGVLRLLIIAFAALWLTIDARKETHYLKRITEIAALIMAIFLAIIVLNMVGVSVSVPVFLLNLQEYIFVISGVLLLIGSFQ